MDVGEVQTKVQWHPWRGWATDKLEAWLEEEARQGWHLVKADRLLNRFHFQKGPERSMRYCIDFQSNVTEEYRRLFADTGWELATQGFGYFIWRTEYMDAQRPEIYSDDESRIDRNQRLLIVLILALVVQIPSLVPLWVFGMVDRLLERPWGKAAIVAYGLVIVALLWAIVDIARRNMKLRERRQ